MISQSDIRKMLKMYSLRKRNELNLLSLLLSLVLFFIPGDVSGIKCFHCAFSTQDEAEDCVELTRGEIVSCTTNYCLWDIFSNRDSPDVQTHGQFSCVDSNDLGQCIIEVGQLAEGGNGDDTPESQQKEFFQISFRASDSIYNKTIVDNLEKCLTGKGVNLNILDTYKTEETTLVVCNKGDYCNTLHPYEEPTTPLPPTPSSSAPPPTAAPPPAPKGVLCYNCSGSSCEKVDDKTSTTLCLSGYCKFHHDSDADVAPGPETATTRGCGRKSEGVCAKEHGDPSHCLDKNTRGKFFDCVRKSSESRGFAKLMNKIMNGRFAKAAQARRSEEEKVVGRWCVCNSKLCNNEEVNGATSLVRMGLASCGLIAVAFLLNPVNIII